MYENPYIPFLYIPNQCDTFVNPSRSLSISNAEGDTLRVATLRAEPADSQFSEMKQDDRAGGGGGGGVNGNENTVSLIVGGKTLYLFNLYDPENPVELAFQVREGRSSSRWAGQLVLSLFKSNVRRFCKREKEL